MDSAQVLEALLSGQSLDELSAEGLMEALMSGELQDLQIAAILVALRAKGATPEELAGFTRSLQKHALGLSTVYPDLVDTCGTGGGIPSFNLSTGAAIVASAAGVPIAKHGNRAVTSKCGSADVLEELGVKLGLDPEHAGMMLDRVGIVFLFAPAHHPAMKSVGPARTALGIRTVFNQLGPLANPAGAKRQLIGVYDFALARPMAEALRLLGSERALIVRGLDGLDEISPCGPTQTIELSQGRIVETSLDLGQFGLEPVPSEALAPGESLAENAAILRAALSGESEHRARALLPNAAAAIWLSGREPSLASAAVAAWEAIESGKAARKLQELIEVSQSP